MRLLVQTAEKNVHGTMNCATRTGLLLLKEDHLEMIYEML